jgi:hypothetical protein
MEDTTILALYDDIDHAATALNKLRSDGGFASEDMMVISSSPFPEGVLEADRTPIRLPVIALVFALVGIGVGVLVAGGSAALYVLRTGGKPILSGPPIAIISYEFMMLFALVFAFLGALYEMRLPSWRAKVYDPRIAEGLIGIAAHCGSETIALQTEELLKTTGAADILRDHRSFE